jgi:general secretion pathway protein D
MLLLLVLAGCAGEAAHREGLDLLGVGRVEEGLAKLEQASREAPDNLVFRSDLLRQREQYVHRMLGAADNERIKGRWEEAEILYERVLGMEPENTRAKAGLVAVRMDSRHAGVLQQAQAAFKKGDLETAQAKLQVILLENRDNSEAKTLQRQIDEQLAKDALSGPSLRSGLKKPISLQFRDANLKMVFEALSRTSGINILFDKDVKGDLKTTIFVKEVSVEDTIDLILLQNQLEKKILSENTVFVYPNLPAKTREYQDLKIRSFQLTNVEAKQMLTLLKTMLKTKDLFIDEKTNTLVMRDTPEAVRLAEKLVATQDLAEPEVMLEVEVLEVGRNRLRELGIKFPDSLTLAVPGGTLADLQNTDSTTIQTTRLSATLNLKLEEADSNVLASPRIRARNKEKAKILIGSRVPVITNSVTPVATGTPVVTGAVQYLDVGLKLDVEPSVHLDGDVAIKIGLEVSTIVREVTNSQPGQSGTLAYEIGARTASTVLRLKDGETQILAGLISDEDRKTANKVPGLGEIPVLGRLFSSHKDDRKKTEIVLSITPHVIRNPNRTEAQLIEFWSGTEASLRTKPLTLNPAGMVAVSSSGGATQPAARAPRPPVPRGGPQKPGAAPGAKPDAAPPAPGETAPPAAQKTLLNWQGPTQAKAGEEFNVTLNVQLPQGASAVPVLIGFDPTALKVVKVTEGDIGKQAAQPPTITSSVDEASGQISVEWSLADSETADKGSLVSVTFIATGEKPKAQLSVAAAVPVPTGTAAPVTFPNAHQITLLP